MLVMTNDSQINFADFERFSGTFLEIDRSKRVFEFSERFRDTLQIAHTCKASHQHFKLLRKL